MNHCQSCSLLINEKSSVLEELKLLTNFHQKFKIDADKFREEWYFTESTLLDQIDMLRNKIRDNDMTIERQRIEIKEEKQLNLELNCDLDTIKEELDFVKTREKEAYQKIKEENRILRKDNQELKSLTSNQHLIIGSLNAKTRSLEESVSSKITENDKTTEKLFELERSLELSKIRHSELENQFKEESRILKDQIDCRSLNSSNSRTDHLKCNRKIEDLERISTKWRTLSLNRKQEISKLKDKIKKAPIKRVRSELRSTKKKLTETRREIKQMNSLFMELKLKQKAELFEVPSNRYNSKHEGLEKFNKLRKSIQLNLE